MARRIISAKFISVWNGKADRIETDCKVDLETKEVFDIEKAADVEHLITLDYELVAYNGIKYPVHQKEDAPVGTHWYN